MSSNLRNEQQETGKILIVGGYGEVGLSIAERLAPGFPGAWLSPVAIPTRQRPPRLKSDMVPKGVPWIFLPPIPATRWTGSPW